LIFPPVLPAFQGASRKKRSDTKTFCRNGRKWTKLPGSAPRFKGHCQRPRKSRSPRQHSNPKPKKQPKTQRATPESRSFHQRKSRNLKISSKQKPQKPKNSQTNHTQNFHGKKTLKV
jgi:hypothetical protein